MDDRRINVPIIPPITQNINIIIPPEDPTRILLTAEETGKSRNTITSIIHENLTCKSTDSDRGAFLDFLRLKTRRVINPAYISQTMNWASNPGKTSGLKTKPKNKY